MSRLCMSLIIAKSSSVRSSPGDSSGFWGGKLLLPRSKATCTSAFQSTLCSILIRNSGLQSILSSCCNWQFASYRSGKLSLLLSQALTEHLRKFDVSNFIIVREGGMALTQWNMIDYFYQRSNYHSHASLSYLSSQLFQNFSDSSIMIS